MSIRSAYKNIHRTTLRMEKEQWLKFKKEVNSMGLTTCFVMRSLIHEWLTKGPPQRHTEKKIEGGEFTPWVYYKEAMSLLRWRIDH